MKSNNRFVWPSIAGTIGFVVGGMGVDNAFLAAAIGFGGVLAWQTLVENRKRIDDLQRAFDQLRAGAARQAPATRQPEQPPAEEPSRPATPPVHVSPLPPRPPEGQAAPPRLPAAPPATLAPSPFENALAAAIRFFTTGNVIAKLGVIMLFLGVSFLAKYVSDRGWLPIEYRLTAAAAGAIAMVALGWRLRERRAFGLLLQGGGIGILYLTIFAAFRLYGLLPAYFAFALLLAATVSSAALAVLQDAQVLAIFGAAGGFLAPVLTSTGSGSHVALFSYYALLNVGIFGVSLFRSWRLLNVIGFAFTFVIGGTWGWKYYKPEYFSSVEPFLLGFFALYVAVAFLFSRRDTSVHGVDAGLLFGAPLVTFALQAGLVADTKYGLAFTAVGLGAFYTLVARQVFRASTPNRFVVQAYLGLGAAFLTLAVPLAFDGKWTAAIWAPEGAAVLWTGLRQRRKLVQGAGGALLLMSAVAFTGAANRPTDVIPFLNAFFVGYVVLALSYLSAGLSLYRDTQRHWAPLPALLAVLSAVWCLTGGAFETESVAPLWWMRLSGEPALSWSARRSVAMHAFILYAVLAAVAYSAAGTRLAWRRLQDFRRGLLPVVAATLVFFGFGFASHPLADIGLAAWTAAIAAHYGLLHRAMHRHGAPFEPEQHFLPLYLGVTLAVWELYWQGTTGLASETWGGFLGALPLAGVVFSLSTYRGSAWPFGPFRKAYLATGMLPLAGAALLYGLSLATLAGDPAPLPYVPFLNPVEIATAGLLVACVYWRQRALDEQAAGALPATAFWGLLAAVAFAALTGAVVRGVHIYAAVPWRADKLLDSAIVHAALSVAWSLVALAAMVWATRSNRRGIWIVGSSLLGVVALKLLVFDLAAQGTLERVVSFLATGVLWLAVGYFAPLPPRKPDEPRENAHA